jgi:hypothetical protein
MTDIQQSYTNVIERIVLLDFIHRLVYVGHRLLSEAYSIYTTFQNLALFPSLGVQLFDTD